MRRNPGFTAVAALSLALAIGGNTAIFSLFNSIMLHPLPVAHPEQLVEFLRKAPDEPRDDGYWGWVYYEQFRAHNHVFSALTGMSFDNAATVRAKDIEPETLVLENVLGDYFQVLGLRPALGRLIEPEDVPASGSGEAVVVSWFYWDSRFHRDPEILGKQLVVNNTPKTIVGVAPRTFTGLRVGARTDVWMPFSNDQLNMIARLQSGVTIEQAQAQMNVLFQEVQRQNPKTTIRRLRTRVELSSAEAGLSRVRDKYGKPLALLMAVVGLLLLLACINLASILLARSAARQQEMAVRLGLGARRGRLVRQMLTESLFLSGAGTLVGAVLAYFGTGALVHIIASGRPAERLEIQVVSDVNTLLFTAGIAIITGLLFGLAPAWYAFRTDPASSLRERGNGGQSPFWRLFGKSLVVAQVALSTVLLTGAVVFLKHVSDLRNLNLGFRRDHVLLMVLNPAPSGYKPAELAGPYRELLSRFESIPGVISAAISGCTPIQGCGGGSTYVAAEGRDEQPEDPRQAALAFVSSKYFETLGIPMLAGRDFTFADAGRSRVAIINLSLARRQFLNANPIGKHIFVLGNQRAGATTKDMEPYEVVAVVGDAKYTQVNELPPPTIYFNMFQEGRLQFQFELRTSVDPASLANTARFLERDILKTVPIRRVTTLEEQVDGAIVPERMIATLSGYFGGLGAALAAVGLYGLLAFTVVRRTNEIGVRMALGASTTSVSGLILQDALFLVGVGLIAGDCAALWSMPVASSLVPDLKVHIGAPLVLSGLSMVAIAVLAAFIPARRAARLDPMAALRHE